MAPYSPVQIGHASGVRSRGVKTSSANDSDSEGDEALSEREIAKKKWVKRLNWVWRKITAAFWVAAACGMIYWTNFFRVIWESPKVNRTYFYLAMACLTFNMSMLLYLSIWCSFIK